MLDLYKEKFRKIEFLVGKFFSLFPLTPNQYTLTSIIFGIGAFYSLTRQNLILATFLFLLASFLDFIDGAVARYKNISTKIGAYLDTICDRYVEGMLLFGMLFLPLPQIFLPPFAWLFLILFGSLITTYAKAAAKEKDLVFSELKGGLLSRGERIILLLIALILGIIEPTFTLMTYCLILIAILTNLTAFQRISSLIKSVKL
jgi:archaetidylinositol phosphate synthase